MVNILQDNWPALFKKIVQRVKVEKRVAGGERK